MKTKSAVFMLFVVVFGLSAGSSCRLMYPKKYMLDTANLREAIDAFVAKGASIRGMVSEIEVNDSEVYFNTGATKFVYSRGFISETRFKSPSSQKDFRPSEIDLSNFEKMKQTALAQAAKNSYLENPYVSRVVFTKDSVDRDDNLVSGVDKWREAIRCHVYVNDADTEAKYTMNLKGELVDVAETNVKPRIKFMNYAQMKKSLAEIKPLFGGKLEIADLTIHIEDFSLTARDPQKPEELNLYRFNSQEFLRADKSISQRSIEDRKREEEMRRSGASEEEIRFRFPQMHFFDIDEVNLALIDSVISKTLAATRVSSPVVRDITIRKSEDRFKKTVELIWRVETVGDRSETEMFTFDAAGGLKTDK